MLNINNILGRRKSGSAKASLGLGLSPGSHHYRAYVGPPEDYDLVAAMTFNLATTLGLRQHHTVLDVGCGSLRIGRLLIPYLNMGNYAGIEPNRWLVSEGISCEIGQDQVDVKQPRFYFSTSADPLPTGELYDFALAQSIFSHCGPDLIGQWLHDIAAHLRDSGVLLSTFLIGDQDSPNNGWTYPECVKYRVETMARFAHVAGLEFLLLDWKHPRQWWALYAKPNFDTKWFQNRPLTWNTFLEFGPKTAGA